MVSPDEFPAHAQAIVAPNVDAEQQLKLLREVKDAIPALDMHSHVRLLETYWPTFVRVLDSVAVVQQAASPQPKVRKAVLEILQRFSSSEVARPRALEMMDLACRVLYVDTEEAVILSLSICFNLCRAFRAALEPKLLALMEFVKLVYGNAQAMHEHHFGAAAGEEQAGAENAGGRLVQGTLSFKVLAETPISVMQTLQFYPVQQKHWVPQLVPLMAGFTFLEGPDQVNPERQLTDRQKQAQQEMTQGVVKTLTFLIYTIRTPIGGSVRPHQDALVAVIVRLLRTCTVPLFRKELLNILRQSMQSSARMSLHAHMSSLLEERTLVGEGHLCHIELRPQAYGVLAEVVHCLRNELSLEDLARIISIFIRNLHDDRLAVGVQGTGCRLLSNLAEVIFKDRANLHQLEQRRALLARILVAMVSKIATIRESLPTFMVPLKEQAAEAAKAQAAKATNGESKAGKQEPVAEKPKPQVPLQNALDRTPHELQASEARHLLTYLIKGAMSLLFTLSNLGNTTPVNPQAPVQRETKGLREEELRLASRAIVSIIPCLRIFYPPYRRGEGEIGHYDQLADVIINLQQDPRDVVELFSRHMGFIFQATLEDPKLLRTFQKLLDSPCHRQFASVLLQFLLDERMGSLRRPESKEGQLTYKLFMLFLETLKKYQSHIEPVLVPLFPRLINSIVQHTTESEEKLGYMELMLQLFRNTYTANYDSLHIIFGGAGNTPALLPSVLNLLCGILDGPGCQNLHSKVIEACLIMPARLGEQLAALSKLMTPVVLALEGRDHLVNLALRTLEYWVDSLNPEFLEPAMANVADRLMEALASHLKLPPHLFGARALQLLGKVGGRCRKGKEVPSLVHRDNPENGLRFYLTFQPSPPFLLPMDSILAACSRAFRSRLDGPEHVVHRREALKLVVASASTVLDLRSPLDSRLPGRSIDKLTAMLFGQEVSQSPDGGNAESEHNNKTPMQILAERKVLQTMLVDIITCAGNPELADIAEPFAMGLSRHFAFLYATDTSTRKGPDGRPIKPVSLRHIDLHVYLDALVEGLSKEDTQSSVSARNNMKLFVTTLVEVCNAQRRLHTARLAAAVDGVSDGGTPGRSTPTRRSPTPRGAATPPRRSPTPPPNQDATATPAPSSGGSPKASGKASGYREGGFPPVLDDFMGRLIHMCYGDTWATKFGGASAMVMLGGKLPVGQLMTRVAPCVKGLLAVMRGLPEHSVCERKQILESLDFLVRRCFMRGGNGKGASSSTTRLQSRASTPQLDVKGEPSSEATPMEVDGKDGEESDAKSVETVAEGSAKAREQLASTAKSPGGRGYRSIRPAAEEKAMSQVVSNVMMEIFNPPSSADVRAAADSVLVLVAEASGKSKAELLTGLLENLQPVLNKRLLLPLRHVPTQTGYAASLTYCLQQDPPLVSLTPEVVALVGQAYTICSDDSPSLLQTITSSARQPAMDAMPALRRQCLSLVCAALSWAEFRTAPSVEPTPAPQQPAEGGQEVKEEPRELGIRPDEKKPSNAPPPSDYRDGGELEALRKNIVALLFKQLTSTDAPTVAEAEAGLGALVATSKISKQLMQSSIRPVLNGISHYKHLKLHLLHGLVRLLKLMPGYFNVAVGDKLLDHLTHWMKPDEIKNNKPWDASQGFSQDPEVAVAILELFHLLPFKASMYLETVQTGQHKRAGLVVVTIELEKALSQTMGNMQPTKTWSPYRDPLAKFLNRYAPMSVDYYLAPFRISKPTYVWHLLDIIRAPIGRPLLLQLAKTPEKIAELLTREPEQIAQEQLNFHADAQLNALHLAAAVVKLLPDWLPDSLFQVLYQRWKSDGRKSRLADEGNLSRTQMSESKWIAKCMLNYISRNRSHVEALFDLSTLLRSGTTVNLSFLRKFLTETVPAIYSVDEKKAVVRFFLEAYTKREQMGYTQGHLVEAARLLVRPLVTKSLEAGEDVIDVDIIETFCKHIWGVASEDAKAYGEEMNIEMLDLSSTILSHPKDYLQPRRQELVQFGWYHLKNEESTARPHAFRNVTSFLQNFDVPPKLVVQLLVNLVKAYQADYRRSNVRAALDMLGPVLLKPRNPKYQEGGRAAYPTWGRPLKQLLEEETQNKLMRIHFWQFVVRHPDVFYPCRKDFAWMMASALVNLGLSMATNGDNRRLAIDMAGVLVSWEKRRIEAAKQAASPGKRSADQAGLKADEGPAKKQTKLEAGGKVEQGTPAAEGGSSQGTGAAETPAPQSAGASRPPSRQASAGSIRPEGEEEEEEEYKLPPVCQEHVLNLATRMIVLVGDMAHKDEYQLILSRAMELLESALSVWPDVNVNLSFLTKAVYPKLANNPDNPPSVQTPLDIIERVLAVQPERLVRDSADHINTLMDACFKIKSPGVIATLASVLKRIHALYPPASPDNPAKALEDRLHQAMKDHLHGAGTSSAISPGSCLPGVSTSLTLVKAIEGEVPGFMLPNFLPHMVRLLGRLAGENSAIQGLLLARKEEALTRATLKEAMKPRLEPEYGSPAWAVREILTLTRPLVTQMGDQKRSYIQSLFLLASPASASRIDPAVLMALLESVETWILDPNIAQSAMLDKDALHILQRFAALQHENQVARSVRPLFEAKLLRLLYNVCSQPGPYGPQFQTEVFDKVERAYMLGLKATSQEMRRKFFQIYNRTIPTPLFDRLQFLICTQNWEKLAGTFWLKEALDILMACVDGSQTVRLANNSAQIPGLLSQTKPLAQPDSLKPSGGSAASALGGPASSQPATSAPQMGPNQRVGVAGRPAQMHFGPGQHTYIPQQGFQYPQGMQPGGQPFMAMLPQQQQGQNPGMPQSALQGNPQAQGAMSQPPVSLPGWPQMNGGQQPAQAGMPPQSQGMGGAPLQQPPGMATQGMYQRTPSSPMAPGAGGQLAYPGAVPSPRGAVMAQQPGMPNVRPGNFLQTHAQHQQSVAQQLRSQQPITSHPMQGGQPVMSQPQFMAGAAQMASRPPSMLSAAMGMQPRPAQGAPANGGPPQSGAMASLQLPSSSAGQGQPPQSSPSPLPYPGMSQQQMNGLRLPQQLSGGQQQGMYLQQQPGMPLQQMGGQRPQGGYPNGVPGFPNPNPSSMPMGMQYPGLQGLPQQHSGGFPGMQGMGRPPMPGVLPQQGVGMQGDASGNALRPNLQSLTSALAQNSGGQRPLARAGSSATLYNPLTRTPSNLWGAQQLQNQAMQGLSTLGQLQGQPSAGRSTPEDDGLGERSEYKDMDLAPHIDAIMHQHCKFLVQHGSYKAAQLLEWISEVLLLEDQLAYEYWVIMFPLVWGSLSDKKENQVFLAKPVIQLLSQEYHHRQADKRPNVIPCLIEGISQSQPQPKIPSELIKYLGKTFCAWHIALPLLESHSMMFPQDSRYFSSLSDLYTELNEEDVLYGLWKRRCQTLESRNALGWLQHGYLEQAQDTLLLAMSKHANKAYETEGSKVGKNEQIMWQRKYMECCNQMGQWKTLVDYGRSVEDFSLLATSYVKTSDWRSLKEEILPCSALLEETAATHTIHAHALLQEGMAADAEIQTSAAIEKALHKCWAMPKLGLWANGHLLAQFQEIVELQESRRLLYDIGRQNQRHDNEFRNIKDIMETWRLRTPNMWEDFGSWSDLLVWRIQIYNIIIDAFKGYAEVNPVLYQMGYRDKAWSVNRLARVARKHGCPETSKMVINSMYGHDAMEVQEAFTKIQEQSKTLFLQPELINVALNLLNGQNLAYFQPHHQAELFRLRGICFQELKQPEQANSSFSTSLTLCGQLPQGWLSWACFCNTQFNETKDPSWLESAVTAYLQAIRQGSATGRALIPRLLMLLSSESRVVEKALEKSIRQVPHWVWLAWVPQLLTGTQRAESAFCKHILKELARLFPQAVYYGTRANGLLTREGAHKAMNEKREEAKAKAAAPSPAPTPMPTPGQAPGSQPQAGNPPGGSQPAAAAAPQPNGVPAAATPAQGMPPSGAPRPAQPPSGSSRPEGKLPEMQAFDAGREVMEQLKIAHPHMCSILEVLSYEISSRFSTRPLERLLGVMMTLLQKTYKMPFSNMVPIPANLVKELDGVCRALFLQPESRAKHGPAMHALKETFMRELCPTDNPDFPGNLGELVQRLKVWRNRLQQLIQEVIGPVLRLEEESRVLMDLNFADIEMPGQFQDGNEVVTDAIVRLESIGSDVVIVRRQGTAVRRLAFHGSNGKTRYFTLQCSQVYASGEEKQIQLLRMLNKLLDKHPKSRQRCLAYSTPTVVPLMHYVRMIEEDPSYSTFMEAYELHCARTGKDTDLPIVKFKHLCCTEQGVTSDPQGVNRVTAFVDVTKNHVSSQIFTSYVHKLQTDHNRLWLFKKQLCKNLALSGLLSHMLLVGGRSPNKLLISKESGKVHQLEFYATYSGEGMLERIDPVPFRLTKNLQEFFTHYGVEGWFVSTLAAGADAFMGRHNNLADVVGLFLRDDILQFLTKRFTKNNCVAALNLSPASLQETVKQNLERVTERMKEVSPANYKLGEAEDPQRAARTLVAEALDPRLLCKADPTWHPWY